MNPERSNAPHGLKPSTAGTRSISGRSQMAMSPSKRQMVRHCPYRPYSATAASISSREGARISRISSERVLTARVLALRVEAYFVNRHNAGMIELRGDLRFFKKAGEVNT